MKRLRLHDRDVWIGYHDVFGVVIYDRKMQRDLPVYCVRLWLASRSDFEEVQKRIARRGFRKKDIQFAQAVDVYSERLRYTHPEDGGFGQTPLSDFVDVEEQDAEYANRQRREYEEWLDLRLTDDPDAFDEWVAYRAYLEETDEDQPPGSETYPEVVEPEITSDEQKYYEPYDDPSKN